MTARTKTVLILLGTLVLGIVIGGLGAGAIISHRVEQFQRLRAHGGFSRMIEEVIRPTDSTQRAKIRVVLDSIAARQWRLREETIRRDRQIMDSGRVALDPLLTAEQKQRLDDLRRRAHRVDHRRPFGAADGPLQPPERSGPGDSAEPRAR